jgi:F-type H+-transporting ATPase subunit delta
LIATVVSRRYAKALFAVGQEKGEIEAYGKDLAEMAGVLEESPELLRVFANPVFSPEQKKNILEGLFQKVEISQMVKNFMKLLADKGRLGKLPEISQYYQVLLDEAQGVVRGELTTAIDLDDAKQKSIKEQLEKQFEKSLVLDYQADENILGGVVLKVGDRVLDASLRAQLNILKENIKRGE